jgi:hypothetical protein
MFANKVLSRIFVPKIEEVTGVGEDCIMKSLILGTV